MRSHLFTPRTYVHDDQVQSSRDEPQAPYMFGRSTRFSSGGGGLSGERSDEPCDERPPI
jgi:hypothetical protein